MTDPLLLFILTGFMIFVMSVGYEWIAVGVVKSQMTSCLSGWCLKVDL